MWKTLISSEGQMDDLRFVIPVLIAAAKPYWEKDTTMKRGIMISEKEVSDIIL